MENINQDKYQNWFNIMWNHAKQMEEPSIRNSPDKEAAPCAFRGNKGNKCLVGALILDEQYSPGLEIEALSSVHFEKIFGYSSKNDIEFLITCQRAHDDFAHLDHDEWKSSMLARLQTIAKEWNLSIP